MKMITVLLLMFTYVQGHSQSILDEKKASIREKAIMNGLNAVEAYNAFFSTKDKSNLIDAVSLASKANVLFDLYIEIENVPKESQLILININIDRLSNVYAKELLKSEEHTFDVIDNKVKSSSEATARQLMSIITSMDIIKTWLGTWEKRDFSH